MRNRIRKKLTNLEKVSLHIEPMIVEDCPIKLDRNVIFIKKPQGSGYSYFPTYINAPLDLTKESPYDIISRYANPEKDGYMVVGSEFKNNCKQLYITLGKRGTKNKAVPLETWICKDLGINIYMVDVYRYDRIDNERYYEVQLETPDRDVFYINEADIPSEVSPYNYIKQLMLQLYHLKDHTQGLRHVIYRLHTANKSNNYLGYVKVSDIPDSQRITRQKLADLAAYITSQGTNIHGENGLGIFIGWLAYWNKFKATNIISNELISNERTQFMEIFNKILDYVEEH